MFKAVKEPLPETPIETERMSSPAPTTLEPRFSGEALELIVKLAGNVIEGPDNREANPEGGTCKLVIEARAVTDPEPERWAVTSKVVEPGSPTYVRFPLGPRY